MYASSSFFLFSVKRSALLRSPARSHSGYLRTAGAQTALRTASPSDLGCLEQGRGGGGLKLARGNSPLQGLWPFLPLPRGVQTAQPIASGETWPRGLQGWEPLGAGCRDSGARAGQPLLLQEEHGAGAQGALVLRGAPGCCLGQSVSTQHSEVRFTAVPSGAVCVAAHLSLCCFVLFLLLSLALYSSCNHSEKNYSCKMQTE